MSRLAALTALVFLAGFANAAAEEERNEETRPAMQRDGFVISGDACGASRFAHLVGEEFAEMYEASLTPEDGNVLAQGRFITIEYEPERLNLVVNGAGLIIAVGCF